MHQSWLEGATRTAFAAALAIAAILGVAPRPALADIQYFYDEVGRLVQVVDHGGDSAQYVYDAAGNIVQIVRVSAGTVSVAGFTPKSGPVGTAVTIYGSGFSATPANNTVQFNGTAATVTSASANQLATTVPAGATTGTIAVTVGAQTATSAESFTVGSGAVGAAPTISGFSPGGGAAGTAVSVTGTNFDPTAINNTLRFNNTQAAIATAASTQLDTTVPTNAGSGRISVRTPYGSALSANDFIVPPSGTAYADIISQARITIDGPSGSLSIGTASKHGIVLFDAAPSDWLSLQISTLSVSPSGPVAYRVLDPRNIQIVAGNVSSTAMSIHLPALTVAGTYAILFSPGAATASLSFGLSRNPVISAAQPTASTPVAVSGQSARAVYTGAAGTTVAFRIAVTSTTPADSSVATTLLKDGLQVATATGSLSKGGAILVANPLLANGTYFVHLAPVNAATASMSVTLDSSMDVAIDGASVPVSTSTPGIGKRLLFSGTAGQQIGVGFAGLTYAPSSGAGTSVIVYRPDGVSLGHAAWGCVPSNPNGGCTNASFVNLPTTGIYQLEIAPPSNVTFSGTVTLSTPVYSALSPGAPVAMTISRAGQPGVFSFTGTAGQPATLRLAIPSTTPGNQNVTMELWGPTGLVGSATGSSSTDGATLNVASLPANGGYSAIVMTKHGATASMTLTLNPGMDLAIDGTPLAVSTSTAGHDKRVLFSGTAGQQIGVGFTGLSYTPSSGAGTTVTIYAPNGNVAGSLTSCLPSNPNGGCSNVQVVNLPSTGAYQAVIDPPSNVTFSGTLSLSTPVSGTLSSATPFALNMTRAGQHGALSFSGTAGQPATLRLAIASTTPGNQNVTMDVWGPTGFVGSVTGSPSTDGSTLRIPSLPASGWYGAYVVPNHSATGSMTLTLNPAMDLAIDGSPLAVSTSTAGYDKRVLFSGTAGQQIGLGFTALSYAPSSGTATSVNVFAPNGSFVWGSPGSTCLPSNPNGGCSNAAVLNLPSTGTYQVIIDPPSNVTFSGTLTLSNPVYSVLTSGTPFALNITRAGQHGAFNFTGTAAQPVTLRLGVASTTPVGQNVLMDVYAPSGLLTTMTGSSSTDGALYYTASLPASGGYGLIVTPRYSSTGSMTVAFNPPMDLALDAASSSISTLSAGTIKRFLFSVGSNERIGIGTTNHVHTPASGSNTTVAILKPDGNTAASVGCGTGGLARCETSLNTVTGGPAGTYTVAVTPPAGVNFGATITLSRHLTGSLTVGGGAVGVSIQRDGQDGWFTFSGTSGQLRRLTVTGVSTTPSGQIVSVHIMRPNFSVLASTNVSGASATLDIPALDATGTFAVYITPVAGAQVGMNIAIDPR